MAKSNNYKGNKNTGKKAPIPRINAKIDNLVDNGSNLRAFASVTVRSCHSWSARYGFQEGLVRFNAFIFLRRP